LGTVVAIDIISRAPRDPAEDEQRSRTLHDHVRGCSGTVYVIVRETGDGRAASLEQTLSDLAGFAGSRLFFQARRAQEDAERTPRSTPPPRL
jgi:hypothetical protein